MAKHSKYLQAIFYQTCIMLTYFFVAIIALKFAVTEEGNATLLWPSSGIALVVILKFGYRYAVGIFWGAFSAGLYVHDPLYVCGLIALGNTLEPILAVYILRLLPFSVKLFHLRDYLLLIIAGSLGAIVSALFGPVSLVFAHFISLSEYPTIALHWWMGSVLGVVLIAPFLLLFNLKIFLHLIQTKHLETLSLLALSMLASLLVLTDFNLNDLVDFDGTYLLAIPLIWSIIRFGHVMTTLLAFMYFSIGIWGLLQHQGIFMDDQLQPNLMLFWGYFITIPLTSILFSYIVTERNVLYQAINSSPTEVYIFSEGDMQFDFLNRAALDNLGLTLPEALKLTPLSVKPLYTKQQFQALLEPLKNKEMASVYFETLHRRHNGSEYPIEVSIHKIEHNNHQCYMASVTDISSRLEKEQHRILGNYVCDISPQAIMVVDKERNIIRINASFTEMTGYEIHEILGENPRILKSGRHDKDFYHALWNDVHTEGYWRGEIYNRRKNGELFLQDLTIKVLYSANGDIENSIAMFTDITEDREQSLHLKHLSEHDILTSLPNRTRLQQEFLFAKASAKRNNSKVGLLFIDLNDFKPINDTYGHTYGDEVLQVIADRMKNCIREMDIVSRIGGDEFIVLVTNIETLDACRILLEKLKDTIAKPININGTPLQVSASIGMAKYPEQGDNLDDLIQVSDISMYADKEKMKQVSLAI